MTNNLIAELETHADHIKNHRLPQSTRDTEDRYRAAARCIRDLEARLAEVDQRYEQIMNYETDLSNKDRRIAELELELQNAEADVLDEYLRAEVLASALKPFSSITVAGQDHTQFAERFPDFANAVATARSALNSQQVSE